MIQQPLFGRVNRSSLGIDLPNRAHFEPQPLALLQTGDDVEQIGD